MGNYWGILLFLFYPKIKKGMITTKKEEGFLKRFFSQAKEVPRDGYILFTTRFLRLFSYGCMSVVLFLYLKEVGINDEKVGALFTCTLIGDLIISLYLTTHADEKIGRKRTLLISAVLKILAGVVFGITGDFVILLLAGIFGVITPSGGEIGPFLPVLKFNLIFFLFLFLFFSLKKRLNNLLYPN